MLFIPIVPGVSFALLAPSTPIYLSNLDFALGIFLFFFFIGPPSGAAVVPVVVE